jgi:hypothetical protein
MTFREFASIVEFFAANILWICIMYNFFCYKYSEILLHMNHRLPRDGTTTTTTVASSPAMGVVPPWEGVVASGVLRIDHDMGSAWESLWYFLEP